MAGRAKLDLSMYVGPGICIEIYKCLELLPLGGKALFVTDCFVFLFHGKGKFYTVKCGCFKNIIFCIDALNHNGTDSKLLKAFYTKILFLLYEFSALL
jgi:hypothetical protein